MKEIIENWKRNVLLHMIHDVVTCNLEGETIDLRVPSRYVNFFVYG